MPKLTRIIFTVFLVLCITSCSNMEKKADIPDPLDEAKTLIEAGQLESGLVVLEVAMDKDPSRLALSNYYRLKASKDKQYERSIAYFKKAVEVKHAKVNEMFYNLAFAYIDKIPSVGPMGAGFLSKRAIKQFQHVLDLHPDDWISTYGIGMNYLHWPDYFKKNHNAMVYLEDATKLQTGTELKPYYILTYIRLGDAYAKNGKLEEAYSVWEEGLTRYPDHPDLAMRFSTPRNEIGSAIRLLYNPNNSIGEINTDISVLWESTVPDSLVPLKTISKQSNSGIEGNESDESVGKGNIGLFSWFMRNLPVLSDKENFKGVDMTALGIGEDDSTHDLASVVAHEMIMGFMSQFEEETPIQARDRANNLNSFQRPFFHEGLGMGYAATASLDDIEELRKLIDTLKKIDPNYTRLHLAGAGMWYGLESENTEKVKDAFQRLGQFGQAYAYEGYGFSQTLFYFKSKPELVNRGTELGEEAAHSFYHGVGRALWILSGEDLTKFRERIERVPAQFHDDAYSGYGMGVAFTKVESQKLYFPI